MAGRRSSADRRRSPAMPFRRAASPAACGANAWAGGSPRDGSGAAVSRRIPSGVTWFSQERSSASGKPIRSSTKTSFSPQGGTSSISSSSSATCSSTHAETAYRTAVWITLRRRSSVKKRIRNLRMRWTACRMTPEGSMSSMSPGLPSSRLRPTIAVVLRTIASCRAHQDCCRASRWAWPCSWPRPVRCCIQPVMRVSRRITPVCTRSFATPACRSRRSSRWPAVRARCPCSRPPSLHFWSSVAIVSLVERAVPRAFQSRAPPRQ